MNQSLRPLFTDIERLAPHLEAGAVILTPNRRLARAVLAAEGSWRSARGETAWQSSRVLPLAQYWTQCWNDAQIQGALEPGVLIDSYAQCQLWERIIEENSEHFSLLNPAQTAKLCQRAYEALTLWQLNRQDPATRQAFELGEDSQSFWQWAELFDGRLEEIGRITPEQAWTQLLEANALPDRPLVLLNADPLPALHESLLSLASDCERIISLGRDAVTPGITAFDTADDELAAAAAWCRQRSEENPGGRFAVVLADMQRDRQALEVHLRREYDCLTSDYESLPVNFATGFSLAGTPLVRDALLALDASRNEVDIESLVSLLQSPFLEVDLSTEHTARLLDELRALYVPQVSQRLLRQLSQSITVEPLGPWMALRDMEASGRLRKLRLYPSQWIVQFKTILTAWGWAQSRSLDSLEYQQFQQWREACAEFAGLDPIIGGCGYDTALHHFNAFLTEQMFQPQTRDRSVQVLGPLETEGLRFDDMWITGMDSGHWPAAPRPNPFIPYSLQKKCRMPHVDAAWEWEWAERRWRRWLKSSGGVLASYVHTRDDVALSPSSFLNQGILQNSAPRSVDPRWLSQSLLYEPTPVDLAPVPLAKDEWAFRHGGSSVLEHQANCPFRAFAALRLRVRPDSDPAPGLLPFERGQILHRALFYLTGEYGSQAGLLAKSASDIQAMLDAAVIDSMRALDRARREVIGPAALDLEQRRLHQLLTEWLDFEKGRACPFTVVAREQSLSFEIGGLPVALRIDRIDSLHASDDNEREGKTLALLDYKTGSPESLSRWMESPPTRPQMPLYAQTEPSPSALVYAVVRPGEIAFKGIGRTKIEKGVEAASRYLPDGTQTDAMHELRHLWSIELASLAEAFLRGDNAVDPSIDACRLCQRQALCRIGDLI